jgi:hypothetical protein
MHVQPSPRVAPMKVKMLLETCLATALLGFASGVLASPTIVLKDGSRIEGEIRSIENGVYTVRSPSLGIVHVAQSNIVRIVYSGDLAQATGSSGKSPSRDDGMAREIEQLQTRIVQDPGAMQSIMNLQSDPQIQAILNDPAIMKAIQEGDFASLLGNAKIQALESDARLQQLLHQQAH